MGFFLNKYQLITVSIILIIICLPINTIAGIDEDLIRAIENNNVRTAKELLDKGANPDTRNRQSYTLLMIAARDKNKKLANLLLEAGAKLNLRNKYGETAIMLASYRGQVDMVKQFYINGAEINHSGWNPLIYAASGGYTQIAQILLSVGADINATSDNGTTALMMAVRGNHYETVEFLLKSGADPKIKNETEGTALSWAIQRGNKKIAQLLKDNSTLE